MKVKISDGNTIDIDEADYYKFIVGNTVKVGRHGYVTVSRVGMLHRAIMGISDPKILVDHKDRNKLNNLSSNLRPANKSTNAMNRGKPKSNTSGYKGVSWNREKGLWDADIQLDNKQKFLGRYDTPEEAALAYDYHARRMFGEFAVLNFPDRDEAPRQVRRNSRRGNAPYKGVSLVKASGKYSSRCRVREFAKFLGLFDSPEAAADAYDAYVISCGIPEYANPPR